MEIENGGATWPQVLAIIFASLTSFTYALLFSWTSPSIVAIIKDKQTYDINEEEASYFTVIPSITMVISCLVLPKLNRIGRKSTLLLLAIPYMLSWILIALAKSVYVFYLSRFLTGIADAVLFTTLPAYIGEISTPKVRGTWGNAFTFSLYLGQLFMNILGSYLSIPATAWVCLIFSFIFIVTFAFMPESPYFYLMQGQDEDARKSLQFLRRKVNVNEELAGLKADVVRQMSEFGAWRDLWVIVSNRRAVFAGVFLRISQQLGGLTVFIVYNQFVFEKAGGSVSPQVSSIIYSGILCVLNMCSCFTVDKIGRKKSYLYSLILSGIILLVEGCNFYINNSVNIKYLNWMPLAGMIIYCIFSSFGLGVVPTLMMGELFSASIKIKALCFINIIYGILLSVCSKLFQVLESNVGLYCPFFFYGICCFISAILSGYFVPETMGKTLEEIQQSFRYLGTKKEVKKDVPGLV